MNERAILQCAIDAAHAIARDDFDERSFAAQLAVLFDADGGAALTTIRHHVPTPEVSVVVGGGPSCSDAMAISASPFVGTHPGVAAQRREGTTRGVRISDEVNLRWFWSTETWWAMHGPWNGRYSLGATLQSGRDAVVFIGLNRGTRDFTNEELDALTRLQQPVSAAFRYRRAIENAMGQLDVKNSAHPGPVLPTNVARLRGAPTPREAQVLTLMAAGWTNEQIASRLFISERTVRKHLSAVYEKAGLPGRAAAASWWERQRDLE